MSETRRLLQPDWFTSDLHWSHARICELAGRPFESVEQMNDALVERWNDTVADTDEVLVLGDWALGKIAESLPITGRLRGRLVLVPGNHDRCWTGHKKTGSWDEEYRLAGFADIVHERAYVRVGSRTVGVSHFPYSGDSTGEERYAEHRPVDRGEWLAHGHVHGAWRQAGRQVNVGVDAWGGQLVSAADLEAVVSAGPADLPPLPWQV